MIPLQLDIHKYERGKFVSQIHAQYEYNIILIKMFNNGFLANKKVIITSNVEIWRGDVESDDLNTAKDVWCDTSYSIIKPILDICLKIHNLQLSLNAHQSVLTHRLDFKSTHKQQVSL